MKISDKLKTLPLKKLSEIKDLQGNLKDLSETNFNKLKQSIEEHGFKFPFYVWFDKKGVCWTLDGHQRKRVISSVYGDVEVPYIEVEAKDKKDAKKQILLISSQYGEVTKDGFDEFSFDLEKEFISDFTTFDKWNDIELSEEILETEGDDDIPTEPKNIFVVRGDIFEIKANGVTLRIGCLDSCNSEDISKLMNGSKADLCFTSPPYNQGDRKGGLLTNGKSQVKLYENFTDNKTKKEYFDFCISILNMFSLFVNDLHTISWNVAYNAKSRDDYGKIIFSDLNPFTVKETIIWDKKHSINLPQIGIYSRRCEFVFIMSKNEKYLTSQFYNDCRWNYYEISSNKSQLEDKSHLAAFPLEFAEKNILDFSLNNNNILDLFCGSGTTALACLKTKRNCFTNDISENYVQVSVKRIIDFCEKNNFDYKITLNNESFDISKLNN
jgi:DNA modification methylase